MKIDEASKIVLLEKILPVTGKIIHPIFTESDPQLPPNASKEEIQRYQLEKIREVAHLAYQTPFYKKKFDEARVNINKIRGIEDLKIRVTRKDLEKYENYMRKKNTKITFSAYTSGSSGNPIYISVSPKQFISMLTSAEKPMKIVGISNKKKTLVLFPRLAPSYFAAVIGNSLTGYPFEVADFFNLEDQIKKMKNTQVIIGYATRILNLIQNCKDEDTKNLENIIYSGESLPESGKEFIEKKTQAKVYGVYATIEALGPIGVMCQKGNYHLIPELFSIEIDKNKDILLTCLDPNRATILLRYEVGDKGEWTNCNCGITYPAFKVEGKFKHLTSQRIEAAIYASQAFRDGHISPYFDFEEKFEGGKRVFTVYLEKRNNEDLQGIADEVQDIIIHGNKKNLKPIKPLEVMIEGNMVDVQVKFKDGLNQKIKNPRFW